MKFLVELPQQEVAMIGDEPERRLATGDDGVDAGAIAVVGTHTAVAVAIEGRRIAAIATIALTGDQIDERGILGLLHKLPHWLRRWARAAGLGGWVCDAAWGARAVPSRQRFWHSIRGQTPTAKGVLFERGQGDSPVTK